jgi:hypothetical protein
VNGETSVGFVRTARDGSNEPIERSVPLERPVAIEFNGIGYAVMMATPCVLEDFAVGFALSERLVARLDEIIEVECGYGENWVVRRLAAFAGNLSKAEATWRSVRPAASTRLGFSVVLARSAPPRGSLPMIVCCQSTDERPGRSPSFDRAFHTAGMQNPVAYCFRRKHVLCTSRSPRLLKWHHLAVDTCRCRVRPRSPSPVLQKACAR